MFFPDSREGSSDSVGPRVQSKLINTDRVSKRSVIGLFFSDHTSISIPVKLIPIDHASSIEMR